MSYEVPSDAKRDRQIRLEIDRNRNLAKFSPTYSTQTSQENIGTGGTGGSAAIGVTTGNLFLNPEIHVVSVQLSWTGGTGDLAIGDIVDSSTTAWQGRLLFITTGTSTTGTGVFEPTNATVFVDGTQTLTETPAGWVGTYTNTSIVTGQLVITSASMIINDLSGNPTVKTIHGAKNDGQFTTLKPLEGKTLTITSGGNIDTAGFTVADSVFATLQFHSENITPAAGGSWTVALAASGGGTSPPFSDSTDLLKGSADDTKLLRFEIDGFTAATTRTITIPNTTTTMAGLGVLSQIWTGTNDFVGITKVRDGTNYFMQNIADNTKQVDWDLSAITAGTTRTITMPDADVTLGAGGGGSEFADNVFRVTGSADATKKLAFEVDGFTTATTRTWTVPNTTTTMAGLGVPSQTWTGTNRFAGLTDMIAVNFSIIDFGDNTKEMRFNVSGISTGTVRTWTVPDTTTTLAGLGVLSQIWTGTNDFQGITKVEDTSNFTIQNIADNTKQVRFDLVNISTGTIRTITIPNTTSTMALLGVPSQTWTGTNDFAGITDVRDSNFSIQDTGDPTRELRFDVGGISTSTIRTITVPNTTGTLPLLEVPSQTWTGTNDFIGITEVKDGSSFLIKNAADTTKKVDWDLNTITTGTTRTITMPDEDVTLGSGVPPFLDTTALVKGSVDATKLLRFEIDGFTTATTRIITVPNTTSTMALLGVPSQTWTGTNDFIGITEVKDGASFKTKNAADTSKIVIWDLSAITTSTTRTITMPDANVDLGALGGDKISEGDSHVEVIDAGTGVIDIQLDGSVRVNFDANRMGFNTDGIYDIGTNTSRPEFIYADNFDIQDDIVNNPNSGRTQITGDTGGMNLGGASAGSIISMWYGGNERIQFKEDRIEWVEAGIGHEWRANSSSFEMLTANESDDINFWTGTGRTNRTMRVDDLLIDLESETTDTSPMELRFFFRNTNPGGLSDPDFGRIKFIGEDSANNFDVFALLTGGQIDDTSASEVGFSQWGIVTDGALAAVITIEGQTSSTTIGKLGFFNKANLGSPVVQQSVGSDTLANLYTAMRNYGLIA